MKRLADLILCVCVIAQGTLLLAAVADPVRLDTGLISGVSGASAEVRVFKGIPYAAPPVGSLRWRPPQPAQPWGGVRKADQFGPMCMQTRPTAGPSTVSSGPPMSEDCLYLNVWTAANSSAERRPVIIWSHGGGYQTGTGASPQFDGESLAKKGVVLVTYNYRLGVFGFFAHPELTAESGRHASGNYALMDLAAALRWIQKNIASFGGDPRRVTIDGVSAGGGLVANLVGSPVAKGLFQRAISQSCGWMGLSIGNPMALSQAEAAGVKMAQTMGVNSLAGLRAKSAEELLKLGRGTGPIVDGWFIPDELSNIYLQGKQNDVDVLLGSNKDEGTFFARPGGTGAETFLNQSRRRFGELADAFLKLYPAGSDAEAGTSQLAAFRDELRWQMQAWARLQSKLGRARAYLYYFTHEPPAAEGMSSRGATHGAEQAYMFQNLSQGRTPWTDTDRQLADTMSSYWANFAANGDPNGRGLPVWPAFREQTSERPISLGDKVELGPAADSARMGFYDSYFARQRASNR